MKQRSRVNILDDSYCHYLSSDPKNYLFSSPDEICHWSDSVTASLSPLDSADLETLSQPESSRGYSDSSSSYNMDPSAYQLASGSNQWSPELMPETSPETDLYHAGVWTDQLPRHMPFSPVMSDFTVPTSETSLFSLGPSAAQELPMADPFATANWSTELADRSYMDESAVSEPSFFSYPDVTQPEVTRAVYPSWFTPSEVNFDNYFPMDQPQGLAGFAQVAPQTAGFVGNAPLVPSSQAGSYQSAESQFNSVRGAREPACVQTGLPSGQFSQASQSPELTQTRPPRRLSVAVRSQACWSPQEADQKPYCAPAVQHASANVHNIGSVPMSRQHRSSNASVVGSTCSGVSSIASSVAQIKMERSASAISSASQARSEDSEGKPRSHRYYTTAKPHLDGFYHCPYIHTGTCTHKPTKLKCNYDKYIDSHLKPFVCKQEECKGQDNENRFSSTACLLRHEREAHGLHGHGTKPYTCQYEGCERSVPGNGFPRNYNLMDHMKRVHRHRPEDKIPSPLGSSSGKRGPKSDTYKVKKSRKTPEAPKRTHTSSSSTSSSRRQMVSPIPTSQEYNQPMVDFAACSDKPQMHMRCNPSDAANMASQMQQFSRGISSRYG